MRLLILVATGVLLLCQVGQTTAQPWTQCPMQDPPYCCCLVERAREVNITICHLGVNYTASVTLCTQFATGRLIDNPCTPTDCGRGVNSITWVKEICCNEMKDLLNPNQALALIYSALIKATNLCCSPVDFITDPCNPLFCPVNPCDPLICTVPQWSIPNCDSDKECQPGLKNSSLASYCHILALPKCVYKNRNETDPKYGCYQFCGTLNGANCQKDVLGQKCPHYCMIERRYCMKPGGVCCSWINKCSWSAGEDPTVNCHQTCNLDPFNCDDLLMTTSCCQ